MQSKMKPSMSQAHVPGSHAYIPKAEISIELGQGIIQYITFTLEKIEFIFCLFLVLPPSINLHDIGIRLKTVADHL